jgi:hypothetical protein
MRELFPGAISRCKNHQAIEKFSLTMRQKRLICVANQLVRMI